MDARIEQAATRSYSREEYIRLKERIEKIRSHPKVQAALTEAGDMAPRLTFEAFRSGCVIGGYGCRLTIGTLCLLEWARSPFLGLKDSGADPLCPDDIAEALFCLSDDTRNLAIAAVEDEEAWDDSVKRFTRGFSGRTIRDNRDSIIAWFCRIGLALGGSARVADDAPSQTGSKDDWWIATIDMLCHEYSWPVHYALWECPIVMVNRLSRRIVERLTGKRLARITESDAAVETLKAMERVESEAPNE